MLCPLVFVMAVNFWNNETVITIVMSTHIDIVKAV